MPDKGKLSGYIYLMRKIVDRLFSLDLPPGKSAFLWGPRKVGKTYWITHNLSEAKVIDPLKTDVFVEYESQSLHQVNLLITQTSLERPVFHKKLFVLIKPTKTLSYQLLIGAQALDVKLTLFWEIKSLLLKSRAPKKFMQEI